MPFLENQSGVHEFDFNEVEVDGPHITFTTDNGKNFISAVDEWFDQAGNFKELKAKWDNVLRDPKEKEAYYRFIEEDAL